jgi:hypothetical protein
MSEGSTILRLADVQPTTLVLGEVIALAAGL